MRVLCFGSATVAGIQPYSNTFWWELGRSEAQASGPTAPYVLVVQFVASWTLFIAVAVHVSVPYVVLADCSLNSESHLLYCGSLGFVQTMCTV